MKQTFVTITKSKPKPAAGTAPIVLIDTDSEPDITLVEDSDSNGSSDVEILVIGNTRLKPPAAVTATATSRLPKPLTKDKPTKVEVIDLSMDEIVEQSRAAATSQQVNRGRPSSMVQLVDNNVTSVDDYSDDESIPEGFELWEPTVPLRVTRTVPAPKREEKEVTEHDLTWRPPRMDWFRQDCTGASSAGALLEPPHYYGRRTRVEMVEFDFSGVSFSRFGRPRRIREKSMFGPPREAISRLQTGILEEDKMVPIPGMNAPRGAVNCIAQSRGYIAVGRTYEEDAAYDGGGLTLWNVKTQKAQDVRAHITHLPDNGRGLAPQEKQNSVVALAFDPADNTSLLSAGHDNRIQLWCINEDNNTVDRVESRRARRPGCISFCPEGGLVAVGHGEGLQIYDAAQALTPGFLWSSKRKGQEATSVAWGVARSQRKLVAGTQDDDGLVGRLAIIDAIAGKSISLMESESCSSLSVDPSGTVLAFTGCGRDGKPRRHVLRLYDAHRTDWRPTAVIGIPGSKTNTRGEVVEAAWSPDGIHLACARDDNTIDVFDTRWLGQRQSMLVFQHETDSSVSQGENTELYGVQGTVWFGSDTLVSGGGDHCVRVWDIQRNKTRRILATLGGPVGFLAGSEDPELFPVLAGDLLGNSYYLPNRLLVDRS
ncbi:hypothetical protein FRC12_006427 [Ceratobasidium sp. 428]|nr:hypothetical protein FRC12_006427 [Ceratobasidium sp. 428]